MSTPPAPRVLVRAATPDDAEALTMLHLDCWDDAYTGLIPQIRLDLRRRNVPERIEQRRQALETESEQGRTTWVVDDPDSAGRLIGFASAGPVRTQPEEAAGFPDPPQHELYALYTRASAWGTGLGALLLDQATGTAACTLWTLEGNARARAFYTKHGFAPDGAVETVAQLRQLRLVRRDPTLRTQPVRWWT